MSDLRKLTGIPWHIETIFKEEGDERRHRSRCMHNDKATGRCDILCESCTGSAHCMNYFEEFIEQDDMVRSTNQPKKNSYAQLRKQKEKVDRIEVDKLKMNIQVGARVYHKKYGFGTVNNIEGKYFSIGFATGSEIKLDILTCFKTGILELK